MKALLAAMGMLLFVGATSLALAEGDCVGKSKSVKTAGTSGTQTVQSGG